MMAPFLFRCPNTGQNVQGWSADEVTGDDDTYQSFPCIARDIHSRAWGSYLQGERRRA
jgi:hypothetical protein